LAGDSIKDPWISIPSPFTVSRMSEIKDLIGSFAGKLTAVIQTQAIAQARSAIFAALGGDVPVAPRRGPGRPKVAALTAPKKARKKSPPQFCPVPGCKNLAAPALGMVCGKHRDVPKSKIKKYREARRQAKLKAAA
jgi:hypothetical protein